MGKHFPLAMPVIPSILYRISGIIQSWNFGFLSSIRFLDMKALAACIMLSPCLFLLKEMSAPPTQKGEEGESFSFHSSMTCAHGNDIPQQIIFSGMSEQNEPQAWICSNSKVFSLKPATNKKLVARNCQLPVALEHEKNRQRPVRPDRRSCTAIIWIMPTLPTPHTFVICSDLPAV